MFLSAAKVDNDVGLALVCTICVGSAGKLTLAPPIYAVTVGCQGGEAVDTVPAGVAVPAGTAATGVGGALTAGSEPPGALAPPLLLLNAASTASITLGVTRAFFSAISADAETSNSVSFVLIAEIMTLSGIRFLTIKITS